MYTDILPLGYQPGLTLDRYQELMRLPEAAFNGLRKPEDESCVDCAAIWTQRDRNAMKLALAKAEEMREAELGYFTAPKYVSDEEHSIGNSIILRKKHLIAIGTPAQSDVALAVALVLGPELTPNDPVVITVPTTVTDIGELCLFHTGTDVPIHPSAISLVGGNAIIYIPRSRLVKLDLLSDCEDLLDYYINDNFVTSVDVKRCYTASPGAYYVWAGSCNSIADTLQTAYARIIDYRLAVVQVRPANYAAGVWTTTTLSCVNANFPDSIRLSYLSGIRTSVSTEMNTARLAHTLLPDIIPDRIDLCSGCWKGDIIQNEPEMITPYGSTKGAVHVWMADSRAKVGQGGKFPKVR